MSGGASPPNWLTLFTMGPLMAAHQRETERQVENTEQDVAATAIQQQAEATQRVNDEAKKAADAKAAADAIAAEEAAAAAKTAAEANALAKRRRGASSIRTSAQGILGQATVTQKTLLGQ